MKLDPVESMELRRRAEAKIAQGDLPSKLDLDPIRMLHELQVHKIELELQNEELIRATHELDVLRRRYESLYRHAPAGYLTLSMTGLVLEANDRAVEMLKRDVLVLLNQPLRDCFAVESIPAFDEMLAVSTAGGEASADNLMIKRPRSVPVYTKAQCRKIEFRDQPPVLMLAIMDVSALKYAVDDVISSIKR